MLARILRRFRGAPAPARAAARQPLGLEPLEAREVPAVVYAVTATNVLARFDSATPGTVSTVNVFGFQTSSERIVGLDFRPRTGQLIATTAPTGVTSSATLRTYAIEPRFGIATFIGTIPGTVPGAGDLATGYDFNPTVDRIRVVNANNENFRINPNNGSLAGDDPNLTFTAPATGPVTAVAYDRDFDRTNAAAISTTLYGIDTGSSRLIVQGGLNGSAMSGANGGTITSIGSLGVTIDSGTDAGFDITPSTDNGGLGTALAALTVGGVTGLYSINLSTGAATLIGNIGNGGTAVTGLAVVPASVVVIGSGPGANADVRILDAATGAVRLALVPFGGFQGGVQVAAGDVTGDGVTDAVAAAVAPQGHVKVFNGVTGAEVYSFFAFEGFQGTVNVAAGDVNGDGFDDVIVAANGVNGHVKAFSGRDGSLLASFLAYPGFLGNVSVAAADFDLDGKAEIVTAAAFNGHVRVFNADGTPFSSSSLSASLTSFFLFPGYLGDVFVAAGDLNGDGIPDIVGASGPQSPGHVKAFSSADGSPLASFGASEVTIGRPMGQLGSLAGVGVADVNSDGRFEIVVTPSIELPANVTAFDLDGRVLTRLTGFAGFLGGLTVGGARA